jgi:transcriptional regulator with XRE-family HTH domain
MTESQNVAALVATTVRSVRTAHGMSPENLAARAGVETDALLALEEGKELPSLQTLIQVSDALLIPLARLVEGEPEPVIRLVPPAKQPVLWHGPHGGTGRLIVGSDPKPALELWKWRLEPGRDPERRPAPARRPRDHVRRRGHPDAHPGRTPVHPRSRARRDLRR